MKRMTIRDGVLRKALREFTQGMEYELASAERDGWEGWDDRQFISDRALIARAKRNLTYVGRDKTNDSPKDAFDVANLVMFVWWRRKCESAKEGK